MDSYLNFTVSEDDMSLLEDIIINDSVIPAERYIVAQYKQHIWDMILSKNNKKDAVKELKLLRKTAKEHSTGIKYALFKQNPDYIERIA